MPIHKINNHSINLHPLQNVILISSSTPIPIEEVNNIIGEIVNNKNRYSIHDEELDFDVLVRQDGQLYHYGYDNNGKLNTNSSNRTIEKDGLFHFQFERSEHLLENFQMEGNEFYIEAHLPEKKNDVNPNELAQFIKNNFNDHFELWELENDDLDSEDVQKHMFGLLMAANNLYLVRDRKNQLVGAVGINTTMDNHLAFQSITITHNGLRNKGLMGATLQRITNDFPNALLTAYVVNQQIRSSLGEQSITQSNIANRIPAEKSHYLVKTLEKREIILDRTPHLTM